MKIVLDCWKFCQEKKGLEIYGWCLMPSHVHMITVATNIITSLLKVVLHRIKKCLGLSSLASKYIRLKPENPDQIK